MINKKFIETTNNYIDKKITSIKNGKDFKLILNEVGAGTPVYNLMVSVPSFASKHIVHVESSNNMNFNRMYNELPEDIRFVSDRVSRLLINNTIVRALSCLDSETELNIYGLSNTVQITSTNGGTSHGFFTFFSMLDKEYKTFHYTLPNAVLYSREDEIKLIGIIGLDILDHCINGTKLTNGFIDDIKGQTITTLVDTEYVFTLDKTKKLKDLIDININNEKSLAQEISTNNAFIVNDGNVERFDYILSSGEPILIYKGSFNPVSDAHIKMFEHSIKKNNIKKENAYFCLTLGHRDDKEISSDSMVKRIELLNKLGYKIIVDTLAYFNDIYHRCTLSGHYKNNTIIFPLGYDVYEKLIHDCSNNFDEEVNTSLFVIHFNLFFTHAKFNVFIRDEVEKEYKTFNSHYMDDFKQIDVSSTMIREALKRDAYDEIGELYDSKYRDTIVDFLKTNKEIFI